MRVGSCQDFDIKHFLLEKVYFNIEKLVLKVEYLKKKKNLARVAQLEEQWPSKPKVTGSSPVSSTIKF